MAKKIIFPILTIFWMIVIFMFSMQNGEDSGELSGSIVDSFVHFLYGNKFLDFPIDKQEHILSVWHLLIRKGAHFTEFGILSVFVFFSVMAFKNTYLAYPISILFAFFYAQTDEFHQMFSDGRAGLFTDVLIDTSGAIFFVGIIFVIMLIIKHCKKKKKNKMNIKVN